ncbi:MAG: hypothetical protein R3B68_05415 [Phycisphaerales bacterium]
MTSEAVIDMLQSEPFVPFRVVTSSGRAYDVTNPDLVVPMKSRIFIALADDRSVMVSYLHVASIETLENGHAKRATRRRPRGK